MVKNITIYGDQILKTKLPVVNKDSISEQDLISLIKDMHDTMIAFAGVGIAANQIGRQERMFLIRTENDGYRCFINPEMLSLEDQIDFKDEGCLSIPGVRQDTKRFNKVKLKWQDEAWVEHEEEFEGLMAHIVQHETDHLNGSLYIDQFQQMRKLLVLNKHKKHMKLRIRNR
jgi:peptide deformylase